MDIEPLNEPQSETNPQVVEYSSQAQIPQTPPSNMQRPGSFQPNLNNSTQLPNPGKTLGILGFTCAFFGLFLPGLILSIIGKNKSKSVGMKNGFATAGIWLNIIIPVLAGVALVLITSSSFMGLTNKANMSMVRANASQVKDFAELFYSENNRFPESDSDFRNPIYKVSIPDIIKLANQGSPLNSTNGGTTIWYQYTGSVGASTGGKIQYWDYTTNKVSTQIQYVGDANASSTYFEIQ